jgi:hypothetical protein
MKVLVADIQGFTIDGGFFAKELAITNGAQSNHYLFQLPIAFKSLSEKDRKTANYLTYKIHGLPYSSGTVSYNEIDEIIRTHLCDADIVYVRGYQKKMFIESRLGELRRAVPKIVNVEDFDGNWNPPPKLEQDTPKCLCHLPNLIVMCSLRNCLLIHNWLLNLMPQ